jgi:hypothetical protein
VIDDLEACRTRLVRTLEAAEDANDDFVRDIRARALELSNGRRALWMPIMSSVLVKRHVGTHAGSHRVDHGGVRQGV